MKNMLVSQNLLRKEDMDLQRTQMTAQHEILRKIMENMQVCRLQIFICAGMQVAGIYTCRYVDYMYLCMQVFMYAAIQVAGIYV